MPPPSRRRKSPRKRSTDSKTRPIESNDEELPTLEPIEDDELPTLEPVEADLPTAPDDPRAQLTHEQSGDTLTIRIKLDDDTPKDEVLAAAEPGLRRVLREQRNAVRWNPVVVAFEGQALIPSAAKELVGAILAEADAASGMLQRGYGDERVHEGNPPDAKLRELVTGIRVGDGATRGFDTGVEVPHVAGADLGAALELALQDHRSAFAGKSVTVRAKADQATAVVEHVIALGATKVAVADGAAFPIVYPPLLQLTAGRAATTIAVDATGRDRTDLLAACARELDGLAGDIRERSITIAWPAEFAIDAEIERAFVFDGVARLGARDVAYTFGGDDREPVHPAPVTLDGDGNGRRCTVRTDSGKPPELVRAIQRRIADIAGGDSVRNAAITITIDGEATLARRVRALLLETFEGAGARQVALEDHGRRETLFPRLLTIETGDPITLRVTRGEREADQLLADFTRELADAELGENASVALHTDAGSATLLTDALVEAGAGTVILGGDEAVIVHPPLLHAERDGTTLTLRAAPQADETAMQRQLQRELPPLLAGASAVTLHWDGAKQPFDGAIGAAITQIIASGAASLHLDSGDGRLRQLHPEVVREHVRVLGKKDDSTPPLLMLGIDVSEGAADLPAIETALAARDDIEGRRVLVLFTCDGKETPLDPGDPIAVATREALAGRAAAILEARSHGATILFETVHSELDTLPSGTKVRDPRG